MWKIVIIDDDQTVLDGMKQVIPWADLDAEWAGEALDGKAGLQLIKEVQPDVVITDIYMPVMSGLDMVEQLGGEEFTGKVIILSGYSDFEYARQALRLGVTDYLNKPITVNTMKEVLGNVIASLEEELEQKHKSEELEQRLRLYEPFIELEWVRSVTTGAAHTFAADPQLLPPAYRHWHNKAHIVMGIEIIPTDRLTTVTSKDLSLFRFAITNMVQEICNEVWVDFDYVELFSNHLAIVLHVSEQKQTDQLELRLRKLGTRLIENVAHYLNIRIHIGIGTAKQDWTKIADSTEEAFQAINVKTGAIKPSVPLYFYHCENLIDPCEALVLLRPIKFYQQITELVKSFHEEKAVSVVQEYCRQLAQDSDIMPHSLEQLGQELWTLFHYALFEINVPLEAIIAEEEVKQELRKLRTIVEFDDWLCRHIRSICAYKLRADMVHVKHKQSIDFIVAYIHDHFAEPITIMELADRIYISRNYLSHLFKKIMGESFNNYLTRVRMEKAKEMIVEGKYLIYEIAERVGYKNVPYFSTQFKKYTGQNPTDLYKTML